MTEERKLLIVSYTFPPHPGIGGRRWVKFAKSLAREGYKVHVVCAKNIFDRVSLWNKDAVHQNIEVHAFPFSFQRLFIAPNGLLMKATRKLAERVVRLTPCTSDFITSFPNRHLWGEVERIVRSSGIRNVVVSGDPYMFYYASLLRQRLHFRLILDYRDLWNDHSFYGKYVRFTARQRSFFERAENSALQSADTITFVDRHLLSVVSRRLKRPVPCHVLPNGFDPEDFEHVKEGSPESEALTLFFAGGVSSDLNEYVQDFLKSFREFSLSNTTLYNNTHISLTGEIDQAIISGAEQLGLENLKVARRTFDKETYYARLERSSAGMMILSKEYRHSFITKFSDYLRMKKFMVVIGERGEFTEYLEANRYGIYFDPRDERMFERLWSAYAERVKPSEAEISRFSIPVLTKKLESIINSEPGDGHQIGKLR